MIGIDGSARVHGERREDVPLTYSPSFYFFLFLSLSFCPSFFLLSSFFSTIFLFFNDTSKFHKNLCEIRMWRSSCFLIEYAKKM